MEITAKKNEKQAAENLVGPAGPGLGRPSWHGALGKGRKSSAGLLFHTTVTASKQRAQCGRHGRVSTEQTKPQPSLAEDAVSRPFLSLFIRMHFYIR